MIQMMKISSIKAPSETAARRHQPQDRAIRHEVSAEIKTPSRALVVTTPHHRSPCMRERTRSTAAFLAQLSLQYDNAALRQNARRRRHVEAAATYEHGGHAKGDRHGSKNFLTA